MSPSRAINGERCAKKGSIDRRCLGIRRLLSLWINQLTLVYENETSSRALTSNSLSLTFSLLKSKLSCVWRSIKISSNLTPPLLQRVWKHHFRWSVAWSDDTVQTVGLFYLPVFDVLFSRVNGWRERRKGSVSCLIGCQLRSETFQLVRPFRLLFLFLIISWTSLSLSLSLPSHRPLSSTPYVGEIQFPSYKQRDIRSDYSKEKSPTCVCVPMIIKTSSTHPC